MMIRSLHGVGHIAKAIDSTIPQNTVLVESL